MAERMQDNHLIVVLQCDECGDPRTGCRNVHCALQSRPYAGEDVVPVEHETGARRALPGEGTGMSGVEELAEQLAVAVKALEEIGGLGGPLYLLQPNQGERPDPVAAGRKLREILNRYWGAP